MAAAGGAVGGSDERAVHHGGDIGSLRAVTALDGYAQAARGVGRQGDGGAPCLLAREGRRKKVTGAKTGGRKRMTATKDLHLHELSGSTGQTQVAHLSAHGDDA